jgi:hypothetical protein
MTCIGRNTWSYVILHHYQRINYGDSTDHAWNTVNNIKTSMVVTSRAMVKHEVITRWCFMQEAFMIWWWKSNNTIHFWCKGRNLSVLIFVLFLCTTDCFYCQRSNFFKSSRRSIKQREANLGKVASIPPVIFFGHGSARDSVGTTTYCVKRLPLLYRHGTRL